MFNWDLQVGINCSKCQWRSTDTLSHTEISARLCMLLENLSLTCSIMFRKSRLRQKNGYYENLSLTCSIMFRKSRLRQKNGFLIKKRVF